MSHLFCQSCGTKISYAHAKPNFCGKCGQQLNSTVTANTSENLPILEESVVISKAVQVASPNPITKLELASTLPASILTVTT